MTLRSRSTEKTVELGGMNVGLNQTSTKLPDTLLRVSCDEANRRNHKTPADLPTSQYRQTKEGTASAESEILSTTKEGTARGHFEAVKTETERDRKARTVRSVSHTASEAVPLSGGNGE